MSRRMVEIQKFNESHPRSNIFVRAVFSLCAPGNIILALGSSHILSNSEIRSGRSESVNLSVNSDSAISVVSVAAKDTWKAIKSMAKSTSDVNRSDRSFLEEKRSNKVVVLV